MRNFILKFGFALNAGTAFLLLLANLAPIVPPDSFWPIAFFGLAFPYLVIVNVIFLAIWIIWRSKKFLLPLVVILIGFNNIIDTVQFIPVSHLGEAGIKVLSYNVHNFKYYRKTPKSGTPKFLEYFKSVGSEIICLQEVTLYSNGKLSPQGIVDELPEINYFQRTKSNDIYSGLITFSKYPIINLGEIKFPGSSNLVIFSDIKINNDKIIRVYNCHLQSYSIDPDDYSVMNSSESEKEQIVKARKISYKLKAGFQLRAFQARKVADHIRHSPYPVIVCGDFNDTPVSYAYKQVRGELKDSFVESGWGISNTYNGELPSFRIDYIFCDQKFKASNYKRDRITLSDHFPIHCEVKVD